MIPKTAADSGSPTPSPTPSPIPSPPLLLLGEAADAVGSSSLFPEAGAPVPAATPVFAELEDVGSSPVAVVDVDAELDVVDVVGSSLSSETT